MSPWKTWILGSKFFLYKHALRLIHGRNLVLVTTVFLGILYPTDSCIHSPQNYVRFRTTRLQKECPYLILWKKNPGISLKRQVIWIPHVESNGCIYNSNNQKTSLNLHFPVFELSARWSFCTDSLYPSDIFDEDVVGFFTNRCTLGGYKIPRNTVVLC